MYGVNSKEHTHATKLERNLIDGPKINATLGNVALNC